jgi:hypothetical protein
MEEIKKYYSPSTKGFYDSSVNDVIPEDAVEITYEQWESLLGEQIDFDGKMPFIKVKSAEEIEYESKNAYKWSRLAEYPELRDFADAYYWSQNGNPNLMESYLAKIDTIKQKYPKPQ